MRLGKGDANELTFRQNGQSEDLLQSQLRFPDACVSLLQASNNEKNLAKGKYAHAYTIQSKLEPNMFLGNTLIKMYLKLQSMPHACQVINGMATCNVFTWTMMIAGYIQNWDFKEALKLFNKMKAQGTKPDKVTFIHVFTACARGELIDWGKKVHAELMKARCEPDIIIDSSILDMYAKCGRVKDACLVFDVMPVRDIVSWNTIISGYAHGKDSKRALKLFYQMQEEVKPDKVTFVNVLSGFSADAILLELGKQVHAHALKDGYGSDVFVGSTLVDMYAKFQNLQYAYQVFDRMHGRDVVSWNVIMGGYAEYGGATGVLNLFEKMQLEGVKPNAITFINLLSCSLGDVCRLEQGKQVHAILVKARFFLDIFVGSSLVDMYAKSGDIQSARQVFDMLPIFNIVSWNIMVAGYVLHENEEAAFRLFEQMQLEGVKPDMVTFVNVLSACASITALAQGKCIHATVLKNGCEPHLYVGNILIDMYSKCGDIRNARQVFEKMPLRDPISWNAIISTSIHFDDGNKVLNFFHQMEQDNLIPDKVTFCNIISTCSIQEEAKFLHANVLKNGHDSDVTVSNTIVDMYIRHGTLNNAYAVFDRMPVRNVISWGTVVTWHAENGDYMETLQLFREMKRECKDPGKVVFVSLLTACTGLAALNESKIIHTHILLGGCQTDVLVGSTLVDMYAKCGKIQDAHQLFNSMYSRDIVSWNVIIAAFGQHGEGVEALKLFNIMQQEGVRANSMTFIAILSACNHACLVDEGCHLLVLMNHEQCMASTLHHLSCTVDLLGRSGHLAEAEELLKGMPLEPNVVAWTSILSACRIHSNVKAVHGH